MLYGERWKSAREAAGFSVQEAADAIGVHRNTIYKLESDKDVTLKLMRDAAATYGVTFGQVFADGEQPERIPSEFRPLLEPLMPLTKEQREKLIKNVASSLSFMHTIYGSAASPTSHANSASSVPYLGQAGNPEVQSSAHQLVETLIGGNQQGHDSGDMDASTREQRRREGATHRKQKQ